MMRLWPQEEHMRGYAHRCGAVSRLFSVGDSVEGRPLWALEISSRPGIEEAKPSFKYVANMHGDEPSGRLAIQPKSNTARY
jgi:carboxypeptidase D